MSHCTDCAKLQTKLDARTAEVQTGAKLCADLTADLDAALTQLVGTNKQAKEEAADQAQADGEIQEIVGKYMEDIARLEAQNTEYKRRLNHQTSCYSAGLQNLRGRIEDVEAQNANLLTHAESNNELLRATSANMAAITEALGPQTYPGSIADAVKALRAKLDSALKAPCPYEEENAALVAKCERLSYPVSDEEEVEHFTLTPILHEDRYVALRNDVDALIAARAGKPSVNSE